MTDHQEAPAPPRRAMSTERETAAGARHSLERTSPIGEMFVGRCVLCGKEGLTTASMVQECANPARISQDDAMLAALEGDHV